MAIRRDASEVRGWRRLGAISLPSLTHRRRERHAKPFIDARRLLCSRANHRVDRFRKKPPLTTAHATLTPLPGFIRGISVACSHLGDGKGRVAVIGRTCRADSLPAGK
jgi:hypothetical protein